MSHLPHPPHCPVCEAHMTITELKCTACNITVQGNFAASRLAELTEEQLNFVEIFIKARGSIKEMERELNISYPTVRNKLDSIVESLSQAEKKVSQATQRVQEKLKQAGLSYEKQLEDHHKREMRQGIVQQLEKGEITANEALARLKELD